MYQLSLNREFNTIFRDHTQPVLLYVSEISGNPNWKHPMHKHEDMCELVLIFEGKGYYVINNKKYSATKGDLLVYNRGILHDESSDPKNTLNTYVLGISNVYIDGLEDMTIIPSFINPIIDVKDSFEKFRSGFQDIIFECSNKLKNHELVCQNIISNIIILVNRIVQTNEADQINTTQSELVLKIRKFIDENYMNDIKLEDLSTEFHFSTYYLSHIFKKELFFSPIDYLIHRRIGEAQKLLLSTKLTTNEIADQVGYPNVNYFGLIFKKVTGVSPAEVRGSSKLDK